MTERNDIQRVRSRATSLSGSQRGASATVPVLSLVDPTSHSEADAGKRKTSILASLSVKRMTLPEVSPSS